MTPCRTLGRVGVVRGDRVEQFWGLGVVGVVAGELGLVDGAGQCCAEGMDEPAIEVCEQRVPCGDQELFAEGGDGVAVVAGAVGPGALLGQGAELFEVVLGAVGGREPGDLDLEGAAGFEGLQEVARGDPTAEGGVDLVPGADVGAAALADLEQAGVDQDADRFAQRRSSDAELLGQDGFGGIR